MPLIANILLVCFHTLIAWVLVEIFVNLSHRLKRYVFIISHYLFVAFAFTSTFFLYNTFFVTFTAFTTMAIAMLFVFFLEILVFKYMYSGDRWFLNYVDWIVPIFIAASSIYFIGILV